MLSESTNMNNAIFVQKRDGSTQEVSFDKILKRMKSLSSGLTVNPHLIAQKLCNRIYDGVKTSELDILGGEICALMITTHPDYQILAGRIAMSNLEKNTSPSFSETVQILYDNVDKNGDRCSLISEELYQTVQKHKTKLNSVIKHKRDSNIGYFGLKTLEKSYLFKVAGKLVERPQYMFMRVALGIHGNNIKDAIETYHGLSEQEYIHATPTLFNAGTKRPQLSSCFLLSMKNDSIDGIYSSLKDCALISKWAGGIGLHVHNIRAKNSVIRGTNGISNGLVPMLRVFNNTARYVDQCVLPQTVIYTTDGPKEIQNCLPGITQIYNRCGKIENIQQVLEHPYEDKILEFTFDKLGCELTITPQHPLYILPEVDNKFNATDIQNRISQNLLSYEWKEAEKVTPQDMVVFTIPQYSQDIDSLSEADCFMYGIISALGGYGIYHQTEYNISLPTPLVETGSAVESNTTQIIKSISTYLGNKTIKHSINCNGKTRCISWEKTVSLPFVYGDFYDVEGKPYISPRWLNLPTQKLIQILKGFLLGNDSLIIKIDGKIMKECLKFMCLRLGFLPEILSKKTYKSLDIFGMYGKDYYEFKIPKTLDISRLLGNLHIQGENLSESSDYESTNSFRIDDKIVCRVMNVKETKYQGILYDLQMSEEHNYLLASGLVHNGGGKRNGSIAIYIEPWHADIFSFLELKKNHGNEEERARDLFYALWISDLFMKRVKTNGVWTLMCPDECPGLSDCYGEEFEELYQKYEAEGRGKQTIKAQDLWSHILESQTETGTPYLLFKDHCNNKSNQKNLGTIKSSNLCCEIVEYSSPEETAVCNLASIGLPKYVKTVEQDGVTKTSFDYEHLMKVVKIVTRNLNKVIDVNFYPIPETRVSNMRHRPIGIGVQGLADVFAMMKLPFDSDEAKEVNRLIFEHIYLAALESSMELSKKREKQMKKYKDVLERVSQNSTDELVEEKEKLEQELNPIREELNRDKYLGTYSSYIGSPCSEGILQYDMWGVEPSEILKSRWDKLKKDIKKYGIRNSLLLAPMPTASTSQIMGNNECIEPYTSNIYLRRVLAGEFIVINEHLVRDLIKIDMWNPEVKDQILVNEGSIQNIEGIPEDLKKIYKTVWELSQKTIIDMAADRGAFICQSQSMNLFIARPDHGKLTSMHFYSWKKGLKTGIYYLRSKPVAKAQQFTIEPEKVQSSVSPTQPIQVEGESLEANAIKACRLDNPDCEACGS